MRTIKVIIFLFIAIVLCVMLAGGLVSCDDKFWGRPYKEKMSELRGTKWKLDYIISEEKPGKQIILEPQDCDTCFTLTFDAKEKWLISGISILNTVRMQFQNFGRPEMDILVSDMDEPYDGNLYSSLISAVSGITSDGKRDLTLFVYNNPDNFFATHYLHFLRINP